MDPKISIIMITKNRASFITQAIASVVKQTFRDWELIVVDGNSKDDTKDRVGEFSKNDNRIKFFNPEINLGISGSRNFGLSLSAGKYVAVLDSDDWWTDADKLQKQYDFLESHPDYVLIGSNMKIVDEKNNFVKNTYFALEDNEIRKKILMSNPFSHSTVMFRKDSAEKVGGYNVDYSEDLELFLKLGRLGKMKNLKEITTSYTKHPDGNSQKRNMVILMTWNQCLMIFRNFGRYPNWFKAIFWAKLRLIKSVMM